MKHSEVVEKLLEEFKNSPIKITPSESPIDKLYDPNEELTQKAFLKYCQMWNKDDGSRKFLRHLISSFLPWDSTKKIETVEDGKNKCCILNLSVAGITEISSKWAELAACRKAMDGKEWFENSDKLSSRDSKKLAGIKREMKPEVRNGRFGYYTEGSNKVLCREAGEALVRFVKEAIDRGDGEIYFLANREKILKENEKKEKKVKKNNFVPQRKKSNCLDEATLDKLRKIKRAMPN